MKLPHLPGGAQLFDVACPASTDCIALGSANHKVLSLQWAHGAWVAMVSPSIKLGLGAPTGLSCRTPSSCMAVGITESQTWASQWSGRSWRNERVTNAGTGSLTGVSCLSAADCIAVGVLSTTTTALIEQWNGRAWSHVQSPKVTQMSALYGVSCIAVSECFAAGNHGGFDASSQHPLFMRN